MQKSVTSNVRQQRLNDYFGDMTSDVFISRLVEFSFSESPVSGQPF